MSTSSAKSFVVTTSINGTDRSQVWNAGAPLPIGFPFRWVAEQTTDGVRIRDVSTATDEVQKNAVQTLTSAMIEKGTSVQLDSKISVRIRPTRDLKAAFATSCAKGGELQIYACVGNWMVQASPIGTRFVATAQGKPAFTIYQSSSEYRVDFHVEGVRVSHSDETDRKSERTGQVGQALQFSGERLDGTTLQLGSMTWRFGHVQTPSMPAGVETADQDSEWFKRSMGMALVGLCVLTAMSWLWPKPKQEELVPEQFTQLVMKSMPKAAPASDSGAKSSAAKITPKKVEDTAVVQAFRAKTLSNAVSGLLKGGMTSLLAQSDFVAGTKQDSKKIFNSTSQSLRATAPNAEGMNAPGVKVAAIGGDGHGTGSAKGVGYKSGEHAGVSGQGKSFVSMDTGGSDVADGLTKDEVGEVIHRHMSEIRYCYESAMLRTPDVEGKLVVNFTIGGPGNVKTASVKQSTLPDPRLDDCVLRRLVTWKFPLTRGGVDVAVSYPFIFKTLGR